MDFGKGIAEWASETQDWVVERPAEMARELFHSIIRLSPRDTGRFLANWHIGNNSPTFSTINTAWHAQKHAEIDATINNEFFLFNKTAYMINNVDYAKNVEEDGWRVTNAYAPVGKSIAIKWIQ